MDGARVDGAGKGVDMKKDYSRFLKICQWRGRWPDLVIGPNEDPYMLRWWLTPWSRFYKEIVWENLTPWQKCVRSLPNIYLHKFMRSDDDRALHDHPWPNMSVLLNGNYIEHMPANRKDWAAGDRRTMTKVRKPGSIVLRRATAVHRVELYNNYVFGKPGPRHTLPGLPVYITGPAPVWSLFMTGPRLRDWGFWCPKGWRPWREFVSTRDGGNEVGRGCDE